MREWNVMELDAILADLAFVEGIKLAEGQDDPLDYEWLNERISIREQHGTHVIERCDGCPEGTKVPTLLVVSEYYDGMGSPSNLGFSYVCRYHLTEG